MTSEAPRGRAWTRRAFVFALPLSGLTAQSGKGRVLPPERARYSDPSTEFPVVRLTGADHASYLPAWYGRAVSRKNAFLLYWSDRDGSPQAFRMDLRTGESEQLTQAAALDGSSITLSRDDRSFYYFDGPSLRQVNLRSLREKEAYRVPGGWERGRGFSLSFDNSRAVLIEVQRGNSRLRLIRPGKRSAQTVLEGPAEMSDPLPRARGDVILYRQGTAGVWLVRYDGRQNRPLPLAPGGIGPAFWSPDGKTILYLSFPEDKTKLNVIREFNPETNTDTLISPTSQFAQFAANGDASVFVGASRNKASPHVLLILRETRRELTLCEHRASDPARVAPIFSPDSQWVYFQSDRDGRPAIYGLAVDKFVERTEA
ncbi:MAG: oligogalacturonate lyase family protein [Acidobacteria bacterium]|nr:oligogalacturonate lyase family protein [Acidobacteriota bacterium]